MDTRDLLKKVRRIEIKTRRLSDHLFSGEYHSSFKGRGMAFSEVRPYQYGDDIRHIHWNLTARTNTPFIKVFEEDRELTLLLAADISGSTHFGTRGAWKRELMAEICATLAFSASQNNDKVGLLLFSDQVELYIPPGKGKYQVLRIIRELLEFEPKSKGTNVGLALETLGRVLKKKAIVFLLSDFMQEGYDSALKLAAKKHDVTGIRLVDAAEETLPHVGLVGMEDAEGGKIQWVDTSSPRVRRQYAKAFQRATDYFQKSFRKSGAGQLSVKSHEDYALKLLAYFQSK